MERSRAEHYFFFASIVLVAALLVLVFLPELNVIALGITFAVLFAPIHRWLLRIMPRAKSIAALLIVLLSVMIILGPFVFFGFQIIFPVINAVFALFAGKLF